MENEAAHDEMLKLFEETLSKFKKYYFNITDKSDNQDLNVIRIIEGRFKELYDTVIAILEKRGDIAIIPKDKMDVITVYQMFEDNGRIFSRVSKIQGDEVLDRMRQLAKLHLLEYTSTPGANHVRELVRDRVAPSHKLVENRNS
jgi:hypothetical protein